MKLGVTEKKILPTTKLLNRSQLHWIVLGILFVVAVVLHFTYKSGFSFSDLFTAQGLTSNSKMVLLEFRLPKVFACILSGAAISVSGVLMQSFFRNPLAGPFVLGVSSGASLGVALFLMGSSVIPALAVLGKIGIVGAAFSGSICVLALVMASAKKLLHNANLLIIGLMWASLTSSVVGILEFFAGANDVKFFLIWSMGSVLNISLSDLWVFGPIIIGTLICILFFLRKLDFLLLGPDYAQTMGVNYKRLSNNILIATCLLAGVTTAYVGPLAFFGLAVPHFSRNFLNSNLHRKLIPHSILLGATYLLWIQLISENVLDNITLPINIISSVIGAPVVIRILLKRAQYDTV